MVHVELAVTDVTSRAGYSAGRGALLVDFVLRGLVIALAFARPAPRAETCTQRRGKYSRQCTLKSEISYLLSQELVFSLSE
jgi:hypothetical protein